MHIYQFKNNILSEQYPSLIDELKGCQVSRILIIDDHQLFRAGLSLVLLQFHGEIEILEATTVGQALVRFAAQPDPDLVLMDWHLPKENPLINLQRLKAKWPSACLVIVSANEALPSQIPIAALGVTGFIPKTASPRMLVDALSTVTQGGTYLPQGRMDTRASNTPFGIDRLTPRQRQVLSALQKGATNKQIAQDLTIAEETVKQHLSVIYGVLGVRGRTEALAAVGQGYGSRL